MLPGSVATINGSTFSYDVRGMGTASGAYPGEFTVPVLRLIRVVIAHAQEQPWGCCGPVLHLFSGASVLGDWRIDLSHDAATIKADVFEWIKTIEAQRPWSVVLLDPPYELSTQKKHAIGYPAAGSRPLSTSVPNRRVFAAWARANVCSLLWLDACAPRPTGFDRAAMYTLLPGGYHRVRILSFLVNRDAAAIAARAT